MATFTVKIKLGNDASRSYVDMAGMLETVTEKVKNKESSGKIRDINGNTVGYWGIEY